MIHKKIDGVEYRVVFKHNHRVPKIDGKEPKVRYDRNHHEGTICTIFENEVVVGEGKAHKMKTDPFVRGAGRWYSFWRAMSSAKVSPAIRKELCVEFVLRSGEHAFDWMRMPNYRV